MLNRTRISRLAVALYLALPSNAVLAQNSPVDAQAAAAAAELAARQQEYQRQQVEREREALNKQMRDFLTDSREVIANRRGISVAEAKREAERKELRKSLRDFQSASEQLSAALGFKSGLKAPAGKIRKSTGPFLDFIKSQNKNRARFDASEFKDFTAKDLAWEALTTAERLAPALAAMIQAEGADSVSAQFLTSLPKLEAELLRLQWMTKKLK